MSDDMIPPAPHDSGESGTTTDPSTDNGLPPVSEQPTDADNPEPSATTPNTGVGESEVPVDEYSNVNTDRVYEDDYVGEPKTVDQEFTYPTHIDPHRQADPHGIYLDDEMRKAAEIQRAKVEGREPDLVDPPASQGTPLVPTHVVKKSVPGDYNVVADKTLPVVVGVNEENLSEYGDAIHARKVDEANAQSDATVDDDEVEDEANNGASEQ